MSGLLRLGLFMMVLASAMGAQGAISGTCAKEFYTVNTRESEYRKQFLQSARYYLDLLLLRETNQNLFKTKQGRSFDLASLRSEIGGVCAVSTDSLFGTQGYGQDITCTTRYSGQWVTKKDSGFNTPVVGIITLGSTVNLDRENDRSALYLHESLGALGYTDDEYQISGALIALAEIQKGDESLAPLLLSSLHIIETHVSAPTYSTKSTEACYRWMHDAEGVVTHADLLSPTEMKQVHGTHIGGGGDPSSLRLKVDVLLASRTYWEKHKVLTAGESDYQKFVHALLGYGIESLEEYVNFGKVIFPVQIHFGRAKRTYANQPAKAAAYLYTEAIRGTPHAWAMAKTHILDHVYCTRLHGGQGCKSAPLDQQFLKLFHHDFLPAE